MTDTRMVLDTECSGPGWMCPFHFLSDFPIQNSFFALSTGQEALQCLSGLRKDVLCLRAKAHMLAPTLRDKGVWTYLPNTLHMWIPSTSHLT